jgi:DNA-binding CsgD family transcriptional regulator/tetratricopeptide (TPR) repeat protein
MPGAPGEGRRVALVAGEPGSGKSRLVREFAHEAAARGSLVLYGACDAVVQTPYRPFVESLEHLVRSTDPGELLEDLGSAAGELTRILPDLEQRVGSLAEPVVAEPDTERHRLHTAVTDLLAATGRRAPLLLILEDVHWADVPTHLLVRHLARAGADARMLLLLTFRDIDAEMPRELTEALVDLRRSDDVVRLHLVGLEADDVAEFVRQAAGAGSELHELATTIGHLSGGNAFLMTELWRTLVDTGALVAAGGRLRLTQPLADLGTPESVREVVSQRLARLQPATSQLVDVAAVAGPVFALALLRRVSRLDEAELLASVDEAAQNGIVEQVPALTLAYRFTHELVRHAVYDRLSAVRRAELHLRVGEALESELGQARSRRLADLAYHFAAAAGIGDPTRAIEYNLLAARAATAALALDEAVARLSTVLELGVPDPAERARIQLELGDACNRAGKAEDAMEAFRAAATLARELGDAELLALAAIGYENACWRPAIADGGAVELLEEATAVLGDDSSSLRVGLLAGLARALDFRGDHDRGAVVRRNAIAMARRVGDQRALATVLMRAYWSRGVHSYEEILDMLTEARELGEELGDVEIRQEAVSWMVPAFVALCDHAAARRELQDLHDMATVLRQPFVLHVAEHYGSALALCDGLLDEADARAERSRQWSGLLTGRDASGVYGIQMFGLRREQGRLAELAPVVRLLPGDGGRSSAWGAGLAVLFSELGMEQEARRELARIRAEGLEQFRETLWLAALTYLTDAASALSDAETAALVYPCLEPYGGGNVMIGHLVSCYGAADRYLGMLATTLGLWADAEERFEAALELNRRLGATTWVAHTAYEYARMLLVRRDPRDAGRASALLGEAAALATGAGMAVLEARVRALGPAVVPATQLPDGLSPREVTILRLVARGLSNRDIGAELTISEHTAANHVRSILRKTGCANRTEAATYAHRRALAD